MISDQPGPIFDGGRREMAGARKREFSSVSREMPMNEFASLDAARAYIETVKGALGSFSECALNQSFQRLHRAYHQFPELELEQPYGSLMEGLPPDMLLPVLQISLRSREVSWCILKPIIALLREQGRADAILQVTAEMLEYLEFSEEAGVSEFGNILSLILTEQRPLETNNSALARAVLSARRRLQIFLPRTQNEQGSSEALLAMAERLRSPSPPAQPNQHPCLSWASGRMSFDEFLLQWPCEIELPPELDEMSFIAEAFKTILLREPDHAEAAQYLRLIREGVSRVWVVQDLLASEELRSLDRRLRVIWEDYVIVEPGKGADQKMPAVTWSRAQSNGATLPAPISPPQNGNS